MLQLLVFSVHTYLKYAMLSTARRITFKVCWLGWRNSHFRRVQEHSGYSQVQQPTIMSELSVFLVPAYEYVAECYHFIILYADLHGNKNQSFAQGRPDIQCKSCRPRAPLPFKGAPSSIILNTKSYIFIYKIICPSGLSPPCIVFRIAQILIWA